MRLARVAVLAAVCGCAPAAPLATEAPTVVFVPAPGAELAAAAAPATPAPAPCPADTVRDHAGGRDVCVRILPSPEIPAWHPPPGHLDPCATWTSDKGLVDCDPRNEAAGATP